MATHSSVLAWEIPWTEKPDGLQSMGSQRVRHNWATKAYCGLWDLSSLIRDRTWALGSESRVLTTGPPENSPHRPILKPAQVLCTSLGATLQGPVLWTAGQRCRGDTPLLSAVLRGLSPTPQTLLLQVLIFPKINGPQEEGPREMLPPPLPSAL